VAAQQGTQSKAAAIGGRAAGIASLAAFLRMARKINLSLNPG
jgi:hypothetical protein